MRWISFPKRNKFHANERCAVKKVHVDKFTSKSVSMKKNRLEMLQTRCKSGKNGSNMLQFPRPAKHPKHLFYFVLGRGFLDSKQEEIKAILT